MTSPDSRRIAVAAAVLATVVCPPAHAGVLAAGDRHSDPVFTGPDVAFAAAFRNEFRVVGISGSVGRRWTLSLPQLRSDAGVGLGIRLAGAGRNRVLAHSLGLASAFSTVRQDALVLAPSRGRGATLAGCGNRLGVDEDAFDADDQRAVYAPRPCEGDGGQRVIVRRHANGAESDLPVHSRHRVSHVRLARKYAAFTDYAPSEDATTLRVFDIDAGTEITTITESGSALGAFALQDDGVVAICRGGVIVEYPIGGATRTLAGSECNGPLVAGDVGYLSVIPGDRAGESILAAFSSGRSRTVARLYGDVDEQGLPDNRGRIAAFRRRYCGGWEIVTARVGGAAARAERRCEGAIDGTPRRVGRELVVRVRCPAGCDGTLSISAPGDRSSRRRVAVRLGRRGTRRFVLALAGAARRGRVQARLRVLQPPFRRSRTVDRATAPRP